MKIFGAQESWKTDIRKELLYRGRRDVERHSAALLLTRQERKINVGRGYEKGQITKNLVINK